MWIFDSLIHLKLTNISNTLDAIGNNLAELVVGGLGVSFVIGGVLTMSNVLAESGQTACFKSYIDNQPLLFFYCSKKYMDEYLKFKNELLILIDNLRKKTSIKDFVATLDGEALLRIIPEIIIPEMKHRKYDVEKYISSLLKVHDQLKKDNVVSIF